VKNKNLDTGIGGGRNGVIGIELVLLSAFAWICGFAVCSHHNHFFYNAVRNRKALVELSEGNGTEKEREAEEPL
jgi:hypothetical protein